MQNLNVAIVEDEFIVAEDLKQTLQKRGYVVCGVFNKAEGTLEELVKRKPDVLLIDIRLNGTLTGIDLAKQVRATMSIPLIYLTANSDKQSYQQAKDTHPAAFLVKPFNSETLLATIDLAILNFSEQSPPKKQSKDAINGVVNDSIFIRANGKHKKLNLDQLLFIEADGSYLILVTHSNRYKLATNLSNFQRKVSDPIFLRVHRSFIVNVSKVESFDETFAYIGEHKVPISKSMRHNFLSAVNLI